LQDLTSTSVPDIILGLHATTNLPSADLLPAVTPLLGSKTLLGHSSPIVRHKTLSALVSLFFVGTGRRDGQSRGTARGLGSFPLDMAKLVKLLRKETESGPAGMMLRLMKLLIVVRCSGTAAH
jgi:hypothetical protein